MIVTVTIVTLMKLLMNSSAPTWRIVLRAVPIPFRLVLVLIIQLLGTLLLSQMVHLLLFLPMPMASHS